ncbi:unnamed protein product [Trifolium pratense]|uniref:Uncharacterized protein n=1 Tax=Trifolium pratense TaxID=57577 RepID=A0ACB0JRN9_TRIPR|nr:unnamed protein product [Trifolium pratense]
MVRPPNNNQNNNNIPNPEGQPTQASNSNATIMAQGSGTSGSSAPSVSFGNIGVTIPSTSSTLSGSITSSISHNVGNSQPGYEDLRSPIRSFLLNQPGLGMPTSLMAGLHNSNPNPEGSTMPSPAASVVGNRTRDIGLQNLTNVTMMSVRQQMDESNHEMVNTLTSQLGTILNPLINNTNNNYQLLAHQMGRIADFFGTPAMPNQNLQPIRNQAHVQNQGFPNEDEVPNNRAPPVVQEEPPVQMVNQVQDPGIVLVNRNQNADEVVRNVQRNNFAQQDNLANLVETILTQNGFNVGLHRPNFVSPLSEYVLQTELPRGWKIPKFTKFAGDTTESTVEHVARFFAEAGNLADNENLRLKYFPNSLTKNVFTWFTTLPPRSIHHWAQLERVFHEQFCMGQSKISLKELASVRRNTPESIDDYLNRFRLLKARCFTQVPEHELVEMAAGGLDYSIRKKLDTQHLRDMAQLADRVRQVERLKAEKARSSKFQKREKIAYVETIDDDEEYVINYEDIEDNEINVAELKPGPPYVCKLLKPLNGKNPVEPKNDKFVAKTYSFDITKCDEIFDLLVTDGQIVVPKGLKVPRLEQQKKRGFCKFHNFLGHKTSQCFLFRDLFQKALKEGRLKFGEKSKQQMKIDEDPLQISDASYVEPVECLMIDAMDLSGGAQLVSIPEEEYYEKMKVVYPGAEEELIDFLQRCKLNKSEVMLCPRCSAVFDKKATEGLNKFIPFRRNKENWPKSRPMKRQNMAHAKPIHQRLGNSSTFVPSNNSPMNKWVHGHASNFVRNSVDKGSSSKSRSSQSGDSKKYAYRNNYMGKNPMTRTQWRRHQRQQKLSLQETQKTENHKGKQVVEATRRPLKERLSQPLADQNVDDKIEEENLEDEDLLESDPEFDVLVNVVSILPAEYDVWSEVTEGEDEFDESELALHKPMCYYVMNNGCLEEHMANFERPTEGMKNHLKPLFIQAKVNNVGVNKVLIDGGAAVNLMPEFMITKIGKFSTDLHPHNIVLSNYEGETGFSLGAIQVDVAVGSTVRPTLFLVVASKANYNLLLGREWIHGVGAVPSTLHQRVSIWREDGVVENIEADQSYFRAETHHITKHSFDKKLANISPCTEQGYAYAPADNVYHSVKLDPTHGFIWEREEIDDGPYVEEGKFRPTGWDFEEYHDD